MMSRRTLNNVERKYDRTAFLLRDFDSRNPNTDSFGDVLIGLDGPMDDSYSEVVLPAGKYAEILYENRLDKRAEAIGLFMKFIEDSGFAPEGYLIFSGALLDAYSIKSESFHFRIEIKLSDRVKSAVKEERGH
jgi:hypothetical protein